MRTLYSVAHKFFGFGPVDVLGYKVILSDREKTIVDCVNRPTLSGGIGEAAYIMATASRSFDWARAVDYLELIAMVPLTRRFGWLADHVGAEILASERERLIHLTGYGRKSIIGPKDAVPGAIGYDDEWRFLSISQGRVASERRT